MSLADHGAPMPVLGISKLRVSQLGLAYRSTRGAVQALRDLTFDVTDGEFVSVLGPSGCGKSSLLKVLSGLVLPTSGEASIGGSNVTAPRRDVGIVFQQPTLLPWKTVTENVLVPIRAMKMPVARFQERASELIELVGLKDFAQHYPHELSGGMQQRVGIARGLIHDPDVLLMDEPFAALDAMSRDFMMEELQRIWMRATKSIVFITHSIPEAVFLSDRVLTLSKRPGRVVDDLKIDLPRARTTETMGSAKFGAYCSKLRAHFTAGGVAA
jgi:NitT/TauT family transport system ATP-binding protein